MFGISAAEEAARSAGLTDDMDEEQREEALSRREGGLTLRDYQLEVKHAFFKCSFDGCPAVRLRGNHIVT